MSRDLGEAKDWLVEEFASGTDCATFGAFEEDLGSSDAAASVITSMLVLRRPDVDPATVSIEPSAVERSGAELES